MLRLSDIDMSLDGLNRHYSSGDFSPAELIRLLLEENTRLNGDNPAWIRLLSEQEVAPYLAALSNMDPTTTPLYGIPFAIKDNIDLAGVPTTAACTEYRYTPTESAFVVQQLVNAGAIPLGKTNLDQFATGLVGVRSPAPWGPVKNALNNDIISGGSSSGSAVVVAKGLASFSLGTDTAGSGRVPASLNNLVGLKPSKGLLSTRGVVPACRSLDCVSIFAVRCSDANRILDVAAQFDAEDAYARRNVYENRRYFSAGESAAKLTIGVPGSSQLNFFGNEEAQNLFQSSLEHLRQLGATLVEIDFQPFAQAANLLYEGPWVAERYLAIQEIIENRSQCLLPVIETIISQGKKASALDAFSAQYKLQTYYQQALTELLKVDAIVTPTAGSFYRIEEVQDEPIRLNSNLGYYTNFMNLLDCAAVALPSGFYKNKVGFGVTLFSTAHTDKHLLSIGAALEKITRLPIGATGKPLQSAPILPSKPYRDYINLVVCGAHLEGLPLNWQLQERGAQLVEKTLSSADYKLYALAGGPPFRPAMLRVSKGGAAIEVEVWKVPTQQLGSFVAEIPAPLGIGKIQLTDGRWESGFICDSSGLDGAEEITHLGGWRAYIAR